MTYEMKINLHIRLLNYILIVLFYCYFPRNNPISSSVGENIENIKFVTE